MAKGWTVPARVFSPSPAVNKRSTARRRCRDPSAAAYCADAAWSRRLNERKSVERCRCRSGRACSRSSRAWAWRWPPRHRSSCHGAACPSSSQPVGHRRYKDAEALLDLLAEIQGSLEVDTHDEEIPIIISHERAGPQAVALMGACVEGMCRAPCVSCTIRPSHQALPSGPPIRPSHQPLIPPSARPNAPPGHFQPWPPPPPLQASRARGRPGAAT